MPGMFFRAFGVKRPRQGQYSTEHRSIAIVPISRNRTCRRVGNREQENFAVVVISCFTCYFWPPQQAHSMFLYRVPFSLVTDVCQVDGFNNGFC